MNGGNRNAVNVISGVATAVRALGFGGQSGERTQADRRLRAGGTYVAKSIVGQHQSCCWSLDYVVVVLVVVKRRVVPEQHVCLL